MSIAIIDANEWLETDGLGGFASGTASGVRTRRYHGLLVSAVTPPTGRFMLVNGLEVVATTAAGRFRLTPQRYAGDVTDAAQVSIDSFQIEPWPTWTLRLPDGTRIVHEIVIAGDGEAGPATIATWRAIESNSNVSISVRPLLSGRDYHGLHHENTDFNFRGEASLGRVTWRPYVGVPAIHAEHNGVYADEPLWYRRFQYDQERDRGFDHAEDLASPGVIRFDLSAAQAVLVLSADDRAASGADATDSAARALGAERARRAAFAGPLERAADDYIVARGNGRTIIAGYPWFADWGRDTFISVRGLCLATGRLADAASMLLEWAGRVCVGMLPNRFPDRGEEPEYNSVDAALWFVIAAHELIAACEAADRPLPAPDARSLTDACDDILSNYETGTGYGIGADADGLLRAGVPGVQLTWMDARVGTWVVTPRHGKPVEVQALWLNALKLAGVSNPRWRELHDRGLASFREKFWNERAGCLYDTIDGPGEPRSDDSLRPNQILAVGGLPVNLLPPARAKLVVEAVERALLTPLGLRSLAPDNPAYCRRYEGGPASRDGAYHQGTVWPWLLGPFVEAWVRVRGGGTDVKAQARERFLTPMLQHLNDAGLGHVSEIADGEPPHAPRGCPFQAWSLGELLRLDRVVLGADRRARRATGGRSAGATPLASRAERPTTPVQHRATR